jgi:hypothetical protein
MFVHDNAVANEPISKAPVPKLESLVLIAARFLGDNIQAIDC